MRFRCFISRAAVVLGILASGCFDLNSLKDWGVTWESPVLPSEIGEDVLVSNSQGRVPVDVRIPDLGVDFRALGEFELAAVDPSSGPVTGGEIVMLIGAGFEEGMEVFFGEMKGLEPFVVNGNYATVETPPHQPGPVDVKIVGGEGQVSVLEGGYVYVAPLEVSTVDPPGGDWTGGYPAVVVGSGFDESCAVFFGGRKALQTVVEDPYALLVSVPPGNCGPVDVTVVCEAGRAIAANGFWYDGAPRVDEITPTAGPASGGFVVRLKGRNFTPHMEVAVGGTPVAEFGLDFKAPTFVEFPAPPGEKGVHSLHLVTECGETIVEAALLYAAPELDPGQVPQIVGVVPQALPACTGGLATIALDPPGDADFTEVYFDGNKAALVGVDEDLGLLDVKVPPAKGPGGVEVEIVTEGGSASLSGAFTFTGQPAITGITPNAGGVEGGTKVVITGCGLPESAEVSFGPLAGLETVVKSSKEITVVTPAGSPGPVDVAVAGSGGITVAPSAFTYFTATPQLYVVDPDYGSIAGGTWVRFHGSGLPLNASPLLGGKPCFMVQYVDSTLIVARAPPSEVGTVDAELSWPGGGVVLPHAFTYFNPTRKKGGTWGGEIDESLNVTVLDSSTGKGVPAALVIVGSNPATPHQGFTDQFGRITFSMPGLEGPQTITAMKQGYSLYSVVHFNAENVTVYLNPIVVSGEEASWVPDEAYVGGRVFWFNKYLVIPPGECQWTGANGDLCKPCTTDEECGNMPGSVQPGYCADIGTGPFCTMPCLAPQDCPEGFVCAKTSFERVGCIPKGGEPTIRCESSKGSIFGNPPDPGPGATTNEHDIYFISTPTGEIAVVCWGGYTDPTTSEFHPTVMGLHRNIVVLEGDVLKDQDVYLDIPLNREGRIAFYELPFHPSGTRAPEIMLSMELGKDGFINLPFKPEWVPEGGYFRVSPLPETHTGALAGATFSIYAIVHSNTSTSIPYAVRMVTGVENLFGDGAVLVGPGGISRLHPPVDGDIVGVVYNSPQDVYVATNKGEVRHFDGVGWTPAGPEGALKEGVTVLVRDSQGWLWAGGKEGSVWRHNGTAWKNVSPAAFPGKVEDIWAAQGKAVILHSGNLIIVGEDISPVNLGGPPGYQLKAVWGADFEDIWVVADASTVWNRTESGWMQVLTQQGYDFEAVDGTGPDDVWLAGSPGLVVHWNGDGFNTYHIDQYRRVSAVLAVGPGKVFAAGEDGLLASFNGVGFDIIPSGTFQDFVCLDYSTGEDTVIAAGYQGYYLGPFMKYPHILQPEADKPFDFSAIEWSYWSANAHADYHQIMLSGESGYPFWYMVVDGEETSVKLPPIVKLLGVNLIPEGELKINLTSSLAPEFDINHYTLSEFSIFRKVSWAVDSNSFK